MIKIPHGEHTRTRTDSLVEHVKAGSMVEDRKGGVDFISTTPIIHRKTNEKLDSHQWNNHTGKGVIDR